MFIFLETEKVHYEHFKTDKILDTSPIYVERYS